MMRTLFTLLSLTSLLLFSNQAAAQSSTPQALDGFSQDRVASQIELEQTLIQSLNPEM
jgi:hypothetical protein